MGSKSHFSITKTKVQIWNIQMLLEKNFIAKMSDEQVAILAEYGFPKFVRHHKAYLEDDILIYKEAVARWQEENMYRMDEINERAGTRK